MAVEEMLKPTYDNQVKEILKGLSEGKTREELAEVYKYKNYKSLDMYMRRKNFTWDSREKTYVPKINKGKRSDQPLLDSSKAGHVISLLSKEGADLKTVAHRLGFKNHVELGKYMTGRGYEWSSEEQNYIQKVGRVTTNHANDKQGAFIKDKKEEVNQSQPHEKAGDLERFLPLLELLENNKSRLLDLLTPGSENGKVPRYVVPGIGKTKTVQMMSNLEELVVDFSREKNISQREIFEVALIEFFRKYGYEYEVDSMLGER